MYMKSMIVTMGYACQSQMVDQVVQFLEEHPTEHKLLSVLFTEDMKEFSKTIGSIAWHIELCARRDKAWPSVFMLYRQGLIRMYEVA